jgi:hypothetical protein
VKPQGEVARRIAAHRKRQYDLIRLPVHKWLRSQFDRLAIDLAAVDELLAGHPAKEIVRLPAVEIDEGEISFCVCRYGRVHTSLTRLPKLARSALTFEGEKLECLDIANSQPLFLSVILQNPAKYENVKFFQSNPYLPLNTQPLPNTQPLSPLSITTPTIALSPVLSTITPTRSDDPKLTIFSSLCEAGNLYEFLSDGRSRDDVKTDLFAAIYGKPRSHNELMAKIKELWPAEAKAIARLKRNDYRYLPRLLQLVESTFIINGVCRRLMAADIPCFTIHDSVLTTPRWVETVRATMLDEFRLVGLRPKIHDMAA